MGSVRVSVCVAVMGVLLAVGCGDDDDGFPTPGAGSGGEAGGSAGSGGSGGSGGSSGSSSSGKPDGGDPAGSGGSSAGSGGSGGAGGSGGTSGADAGPDAGKDAAVETTCGDGVVEGAEACEPGTSKCCKSDCSGPLPQTTVCRAQDGLCDVAEVCDGTAVECPADGFASQGAVCRAADGACDLEDTCDGTSRECADGVQASTVVCRAKDGDCDVEDKCDGSAKACPADAVQPNTFVCRDQNGDCDLADSCDGATKTCADAVQPDTFVCRDKNGDCDVEDKCDGSAKTCGADAVQPDTHVCSPKNGDCDVEDKCDGSAKTCTDTVRPDTFVCRASTGTCDLDDKCNGADKTCTNDVKANNGTLCNDLNPCTDNDSCTSGTCGSTVAHECNDGNDCTSDSCDSTVTSGDPCKHTNLDAVECNDGDECTTGDTCTNGSCDGTGTRSCNDSNVCTDDTCDPLAGCVVEYNTASCSDGDPCTVGDVCTSGNCQPAGQRDCADTNVCTTDSCNSSDNDGDPCVHTANTLSCDDQNSCTTSSQCSNGSCGGSGNACGAGSTSCTPGTPNTCQCGPGFQPNGSGQCVPDTNECNADPCGDNTSCNDPSSAPNNVVCTCLPGYEGNPTTGCTDIDECEDDPCGDYGTCVESTPGPGYSCTCDDGFTTVDGQCVCDLAGTFVIRVDTTLRWSGIDSVEDATGVVLSSWAIRRHTYDTQTGLLSMVTEPCGGPTPDICGTGNAFVQGLGPEAYAQFFPNSIWNESPLLPDQLTTIPGFLEPLPNAAFTTNPQAVLFGITLADPMDDWPANRTEVGTSSAGSTNGARWQDHDGDGQTAVTSYAVPPGGVPANSTPAPPKAYGATSPDCPRSSGGARNSYQYWPYAEVTGIVPFPPFVTTDLYRVKRFRAASRLISHLRGTIKTCDFISGDVRGASAAAMPTPQGRVQSCVACSGFDGSINCNTEVPCNDAQIDFFDLQPQTQQTTAASFVMERAASNITCDQARAFTFHPPPP